MTDYSNGLGCKGLDISTETIASGNIDPDSLEIKIGDDTAKFTEEKGADFKSNDSAEGLIHNSRLFYDWKGLEGAFCVATMFIDGKP